MTKSIAIPTVIRAFCQIAGIVLIAQIAWWSILGQRPDRSFGSVVAAEDPWAFWGGNMIMVAIGLLLICVPYRKKVAQNNNSQDGTAEK